MRPSSETIQINGVVVGPGVRPLDDDEFLFWSIVVGNPDTVQAADEEDGGEDAVNAVKLFSMYHLCDERTGLLEATLIQVGFVFHSV